MLLKIWDTFYLRAKACILCFDMLILIGAGGEKRVQKEKECVCVCVLGVTLSLLSPFSPAFTHLSFAHSVAASVW